MVCCTYYLKVFFSLYLSLGAALRGLTKTIQDSKEKVPEGSKNKTNLLKKLCVIICVTCVSYECILHTTEGNI